MAAASRFVQVANEFLDNLLDIFPFYKILKKATKYGMKILNGKLT